MRQDQTVSEMVDEILSHQAEVLAGRSGQPVDTALQAVMQTAAGRQLGRLRNGPHRNEKARVWQENLLWERARERLRLLVEPGGRPPAVKEDRYTWLDGCLESLEGKEARAEYYARLEEGIVRLKS